MSIFLGNLLPDAISERLDIQLSDEHKALLMEEHQDIAHDVKPGKWHCFDLPFMFVCGDKQTAEKYVKIFSSYDLTHVRQKMQLSWEGAKS